MSTPLDELRAQITANDKAIVSAVNERLRLVAALWKLKQEIGADQLDLGRERDLRAELAAANAGPLSAEATDRLISELLALTKSELG